jgi:TPR repeat protein
MLFGDFQESYDLYQDDEADEHPWASYERENISTFFSGDGGNRNPFLTAIFGEDVTSGTPCISFSQIQGQWLTTASFSFRDITTSDGFPIAKLPQPGAMKVLASSMAFILAREGVRYAVTVPNPDSKIERVKIESGYIDYADLYYPAGSGRVTRQYLKDISSNKDVAQALEPELAEQIRRISERDEARAIELQEQAMKITGDAQVTELAQLRALSEQGDALAQTKLGFMYSNGEGVPQDDVEAARLYRLAADQGDGGAQNNLGLMYADGRGVPHDDVEAVRWHRLAADQGFALAQYNLGVMYRDGDGVPEDDAEAVRWFRLAADQGIGRAQYNLGLMYAMGQGVPGNDALAYMWWSLAAAQGGEDAQENKAIIEQRMTREQIAEGQRLSTEWIEAHPGSN